MTPAKINAGEPTAIKRDPGEEQITSEGQNQNGYARSTRGVS